ncbi:hypothetical protein C7M84_013540 [Penaeus vannamei]|uniref:Uncharacterized protein n=1 Tax=Penaeus vannamei TaxID=6689 RepID=A0A423SVV0_PENVA|nr:hypothetical protein C7M84_013540 [Penaeus vannamei]
MQIEPPDPEASKQTKDHRRLVPGASTVQHSLPPAHSLSLSHQNAIFPSSSFFSLSLFSPFHPKRLVLNYCPFHLPPPPDLSFLFLRSLLRFLYPFFSFPLPSHFPHHPLTLPILFYSSFSPPYSPLFTLLSFSFPYLPPPLPPLLPLPLILLFLLLPLPFSSLLLLFSISSSSPFPSPLSPSASSLSLLHIPVTLISLPISPHLSLLFLSACFPSHSYDISSSLAYLPFPLHFHIDSIHPPPPPLLYLSPSPSLPSSTTLPHPLPTLPRLLFNHSIPPYPPLLSLASSLSLPLPHFPLFVLPSTLLSLSLSLPSTPPLSLTPSLPRPSPSPFSFPSLPFNHPLLLPLFPSLQPTPLLPFLFPPFLPSPSSLHLSLPSSLSFPPSFPPFLPSILPPPPYHPPPPPTPHRIRAPALPLRIKPSCRDH